MYRPPLTQSNRESPSRGRAIWDRHLDERHFRGVSGLVLGAGPLNRSWLESARSHGFESCQAFREARNPLNRQYAGRDRVRAFLRNVLHGHSVLTNTWATDCSDDAKCAPNGRHIPQWPDRCTTAVTPTYSLDAAICVAAGLVPRYNNADCCNRFVAIRRSTYPLGRMPSCHRSLHLGLF
jgi:hypothetical protein